MGRRRFVSSSIFTNILMASLTPRMRPNLSSFQKIVNFQNRLNLKNCIFTSSSSSAPSWKMNSRNIVIPSSSSPSSVNKDSTLLGLEDVMMGFLFGKNKATQLAHSVWKKFVHKGDTVVDATCGNGHDTLAMLQMVADSTRKGRVYAMDVQKLALHNTSSLLDQHVTPDEKQLVELFAMCHSQMEDVVPVGVPVRLVAFNLGYLPGGNKKVITKSDTTLLALEAAKRMLAPGGLISILVYIGHAGGREEYDTVQAFASGLPIENWICCKLEMLNRPLAPVLVLLVKR